MSSILSLEAVFDLYQKQSDKIKFLDATYCMPGAQDLRVQIFSQYRLPNAAFFDIDIIADQESSLPHMLPNANEFSRHVSGLGVMNDSIVIVYAQNHTAMAACRAWWMFRAFGYDSVFVMDGTLQDWMRRGYPVEGLLEDVSYDPMGFMAPASVPEYVISLDQLTNSEDLFIVDARSTERFRGQVPEPRDGLQSGHIPGSYNLPFLEFFQPNGMFIKKVDRDILVQKILSEANGRKVVSSCGSGVTACVLAAVVADSCEGSVLVYDGSWIEYGDISKNMRVNSS